MPVTVLVGLHAHCSPPAGSYDFFRKRRTVVPFGKNGRRTDVDLNRWLKGVYAVPVTEVDDEDGDKIDSEPAER